MKANRSSVPAKNTSQPRRTPRERQGVRWGKAHEQRGLSYTDHAVDFIQQETFQIGKKPSSANLDSWLEERGLLKIPTDQDKASDAWKAHIRRRDVCIGKLRKAGLHPRMTQEFNLPSFNLLWLGAETWEVQAPETVIKDRQFLTQIRAYIETRKRDLDHTLQGIDFTQQPSYLLAMAETLYEDIELLEDTNAGHVASINRKLARFQQSVERSLNIGQVRLALPEA